MRKLLVFPLIFLLPINVNAQGKFKEAKSTHFIILYQNAPEGFVDKTLKRAEYYYEKITEDLGFRRFDFWLWDDRCKIYIYDDAKIYQDASLQPEWSGGATLPKYKIIQTFVSSEAFLDTILPHEMGHIIFREFVGFNNRSIPLWLEEGVASYQEKARYVNADQIIRKSIIDGDFMNLRKLSSLSSTLNLNPKLVNIFYAQSYSVVNFLIKNFGRDKFVLFCQYLRDYKNLETSLRLTYSLSGLDDLEKAWLSYIKK
ncbi:MAG: hypothetical protein FJZ12_00630 [Candidatus Omnitrophica bacterium]|nr:hypothetical protein [Candidatus Omnitrophota bacterium]